MLQKMENVNLVIKLLLLEDFADSLKITSLENCSLVDFFYFYITVWKKKNIFELIMYM